MNKGYQGSSQYKKSLYGLTVEDMTAEQASLFLQDVAYGMEDGPMWYKTEKEAEEACRWKEKEYKSKFYVSKDSEVEDCYWAQRKI